MDRHSSRLWRVHRMYTLIHEHSLLLAATGCALMAGTTRNASGDYIRDPDAAERDRKAMRMQAEGVPLRVIAERLGYHDKSHARQRILRLYRTDSAPDIAAYRESMNDQLDELYAATMEVMKAKHLKVVNGMVVFDPVSGGIMEDDAPVLRSVETALRVLDRRARLYGLDAPSKVQAQVASVRVTVDGAEDV